MKRKSYDDWQAEQAAKQNETLTELQRRTREQFAEEYARMEMASADDFNDEDCSDLG